MKNAASNWDIRTRSRRLDRVRSLATLVAAIARPRGGHPDTTGALERAHRLVEAARKARRAARGRIKSLHIGASGQVVYARARHAEDLATLTTELGDCFAHALAGSGLTITVITRTAPPPAGALRLEDFRRNAELAAANLRAASAALAIGGFVAAGTSSAAAQDGPAPLASLTTSSDWSCGFGPPERLWAVRVRLLADSARQVEVIDEAGTPGAARIANFATSLDESALRGDPLAIVGPNGERIVGITRYDDAAGDRFDLTVASCPAPPAPTPVLPPAPAPFGRDFSELGVDYINRTEQDGVIASGAAQWAVGEAAAVNVQGAVGLIDGDFAAGGQVAAQRFVAVGSSAEAAIGAYLSGVTSRAPNDENLSIARAGLGISIIGEETQIVVRGGYAAASGFSDEEGGFIRAEASWFPVERLSFEVFAEHDPITGDGAGVGVSGRPFSDIYSNLMIDADAAWHEDGEESFRVGFRWLLGDARTSERDRRRSRGMTPYLPQEFERLPENSSQSSNQSYCGDAAADCSTNLLD